MKKISRVICGAYLFAIQIGFMAFAGVYLIIVLLFFYFGASENFFPFLILVVSSFGFIFFILSLFNRISLDNNGNILIRNIFRTKKIRNERSIAFKKSGVPFVYEINYLNKSYFTIPDPDQILKSILKRHSFLTELNKELRKISQ